MFIRTAIAALCLASSSLYGALLVENPYYVTFNDGGFVSSSGEDDRYDSVDGYSAGTYGVSMSGGAWTYAVTGTITGFTDTPNGTTLGFSGGYSLNKLLSNASTLNEVNFSLSMTVYFDTSSTTQISFDMSSFVLTGGFTGSPSITVDGDYVTNGVPIIMEAGSHEIVFLIAGTHTSPNATLSQDFTAMATIIPEPSTWALLAGGVAAAWGVRRRKVA